MLPLCQANEFATLQLLASKPPLNKLVYDYRCDEDVNPYDGYCLNLSTISLALSHIQSTLEQLTIKLDSTTPYAGDYRCYREDGFFTELLAPLTFSCLKFLDIPFLMLTGWKVVPRYIRPFADLLPTSIVHLCLNDDLIGWAGCEWEIRHCLEHLEDLFAAKGMSDGCKMPGLRTVEVHRESLAVEWESAEEATFHNLGQRSGLQTGFIDDFWNP